MASAVDPRARAARVVVFTSFVGVIAVAFACLPRVAFECDADAECSRFGDGRCDEGNCIYPDDTCLFGERYSRFADPAVANTCVRPEGSSGEAGTDGSEATGSSG